MLYILIHCLVKCIVCYNDGSMFQPQ
eukprot:Gb_31205 [translate_table: standard]